VAVSSFRDVVFSSLTVVPGEQRVSVESDLEALGVDPVQWPRMKQSLGLGERAVAGHGVTAADLCTEAAQKLLSRHPGVFPDALLMVTQTPDYEQPGSGHVLHQRLGLPQECAVIDLSMGCSGFVYGMWVAQTLIQGGGLKRVLLCCGDTVSRRVDAEDKTTRILFGDAGAAALLEYRADSPASVYITGADGTGLSHLWIPGGGARHMDTIQNPHHIVMNGPEVFNFSLRVGNVLIPDILAAQGWQVADVDVFYLHQANHFILGSIGKRLKLKADQLPMSSFTRYGNLSSVSVPMAIAEHWHRHQRESRVRQVVIAGFGVGLSWAGAALTLPDDFHCELLDPHTG
jgi:3-oxoacyl-[acyl-carrier-protein] synthase-3